MYWIGTEAEIEAANDKAGILVTGIPEYRDGQELPPDEWVTTRWAIPAQDANGNWFILAHPDIPLPSGCELVESVSLPESGD